MGEDLSDPLLVGNTGTPRFLLGSPPSALCFQTAEPQDPALKANSTLCILVLPLRNRGSLSCPARPNWKQGFGTSFSKDEARRSIEITGFSLTPLLEELVFKGMSIPIQSNRSDNQRELQFPFHGTQPCELSDATIRLSMASAHPNAAKIALKFTE